MISRIDANFIGLRGNIDNPVTLEETQALFNWLKGEPIENIHFPDGEQPELTNEQAFSVIYFLQEALGIIPDHYEMCKGCSEIFDNDSEGTCISDDSEDEDGNPFSEEMHGNYCDNCRPD
jgi:hypothetical protein